MQAVNWKLATAAPCRCDLKDGKSSMKPLLQVGNRVSLTLSSKRQGNSVKGDQPSSALQSCKANPSQTLDKDDST